MSVLRVTVIMCVVKRRDGGCVWILPAEDR